MSSVTPTPVRPPADRPLRRDAERNRLLILDAARQVFAAEGLDAGFDEIARVAGVGVGTVYRRFPERADLVHALFDQEVDRVVARAEAALADPDAWGALRAFLRWSVEAQAADRGLAQLLASSGDRRSGDDRRHRDRIEPLVDALASRAQAAGALRPDVTALDLVLAASLASRVGSPDRPEPRERLLALVLDGAAVDRATPTPLPEPAPTHDDLTRLLAPTRRARSGR
jgi:AcrR family transcriptional regulator